MPTDIVIPSVGESITSGVIAKWTRRDGEIVTRNEAVLELETDKVTMEVTAPVSGRLRTLFPEGAEVQVGAIVGKIDESAKPADPSKDAAPTTKSAPSLKTEPAPPVPSASVQGEVRATPLARKLAQEHGVDLSKVPGTGASGRVREQDVIQAVETSSRPAVAASSGPQAASSAGVTIERMTPLRQRIAARLVEAQHTAAMLTTFNECDMSAVIALRKSYKDAFEKAHGVGLGFMSFFVKAAVGALTRFPLVNASLVMRDGQLAIEKHATCDIAIAVASPKGLVVPVIRDCASLSFSGIESRVKDLSVRARDAKLTLEEMQGGTFTITNGGVFGSLMSTPILNPPQAAILGMHAIKNRAVEDPDRPGQVAVRPMMYLALSYDHRLIDGAEAVRFLVAIKDAIEDPRRLMLEV